MAAKNAKMSEEEEEEEEEEEQESYSYRRGYYQSLYKIYCHNNLKNK